MSSTRVAWVREIALVATIVAVVAICALARARDADTPRAHCERAGRVWLEAGQVVVIRGTMFVVDRTGCQRAPLG